MKWQNYFCDDNMSADKLWDTNSPHTEIPARLLYMFLVLSAPIIRSTLKLQMQSQVQVICRCGVGLNPLKDVQDQESTSLCHGHISNLAVSNKYNCLKVHHPIRQHQSTVLQSSEEILIFRMQFIHTKSSTSTHINFNAVILLHPSQHTFWTAACATPIFLFFW